jgi:hypothetical protein
MGSAHDRLMLDSTFILIVRQALEDNEHHLPTMRTITRVWNSSFLTILLDVLQFELQIQHL